jgi:retron-type reverse transcriptase
MSEKQMSRQELYDEIKKSSKDAFILDEMQRLGFWDESKPKIAKELIEKKVELEKSLNQLSKKIKNPETALKEIHQQRMRDALLRREETRAKREERRLDKQRRREEKKANCIGFLGNSFVHKLKEEISNQELLNANNLFLIKDAKDLANKMGVTLRELRFLTYTQKLSQKTDYVRFKMAKKTGGFREISAPKPQLKRLQYWILENILNRVEVSDKAHGFVSKRNILSNAMPHLNQAVVMNFDLENFFPTVGYPRVRGLFQHLGYSGEVSTLLALLTTEAEQRAVTLDGEPLYLYTGRRYLPQGSPASPMITNLICRKLDRRMEGIATSLGFNYSRYADDMSFSSGVYGNINKMLFWVKKITQEEGFTLHPNKSRIMKKGSRQEVTGVVVNEKPSVNRREMKRFRALLYQIEQDGLEGKSWHGKSENLMSVIWGYANFVKMVDAQKGEKFMNQIRVIMESYPLEKQPISTNLFRLKSAKGEEPLRAEGSATELQEAKNEDASLVKNILNMFRK